MGKSVVVTGFRVSWRPVCLLRTILSEMDTVILSSLASFLCVTYPCDGRVVCQ